ncbi:hypothetical protein [Leifsonia shinshuensis]|uniref:hypothetical protein n=1 Tax=Leifsonia shinshuensis TaxID=150026 RepID=UPI002156091D|nr:hypothetical protein [Leifsonia shinshuensis]
MPDPVVPGSSAHDAAPEPARSRPPLLVALAVILTLEALLVTGLAVWLLYELLTTTPYSYTTSVAITVLVALGAAWLILTLVGILRLHAWARASTVTIQILMIAVAVGSFQGLIGGGPAIGWALLVPAVLAGVLALAPSVVRATARPDLDDADEDDADADRNTGSHE